LLDIQGRIVDTKHITNATSHIEFENLSKLNSGVYFVNVRDNLKTVITTKKIIKL